MYVEFHQTLFDAPRCSWWRRTEIDRRSRVSKKPRQTTTVPDPETSRSDIVEQSFNADAPKPKWALISRTCRRNQVDNSAVVLSHFRRTVVGWSISESLAIPLVTVQRSQPDRSVVTRYGMPDSSQCLFFPVRIDDYQQILRPLNVLLRVSFGML